MSFHVPNNCRLKKPHPELPNTVYLISDDRDGNNGFFIFQSHGYETRCMASDGMDWEHVSVTINRNRTPSWEVMSYVKSIFWDDEDTVIQIHPPKSEYVNHHPNCLHLWKPINFKIPLPQSIQVGPK